MRGAVRTSRVSQSVAIRGPIECHVTTRQRTPGLRTLRQSPCPCSGDIDVLSRTTELFELIENHLGKAFVKVQQAMQVQVHMMQPPSPSNP